MKKLDLTDLYYIVLILLFIGLFSCTEKNDNINSDTQLVKCIKSNFYKGYFVEHEDLFGDLYYKHEDLSISNFLDYRVSVKISGEDIKLTDLESDELLKLLKSDDTKSQKNLRKRYTESCK